MSDRPILYLEPVGGIAGDMFLAAALDLGVSLDELEQGLRSLKVEGWHFKRTTAVRHAISGTHLDVVLDGHHHGDGDEHHTHEAALDSARAHRGPTGPNSPPTEHHTHDHRSLTDIEALIAASALPARAKERAARVFRLIGEAEAKVHGVPVETIHFHEVGAVDSIVDVCGAALVLELLGDPQVFAAPPPLGSGTVRIAHGVVPVPVPATLEILKGVPVLFEGKGELTTPTGAALLKAFATVGAPPSMTVERIGYGVGTKDFAERANVLRASLGRASAQSAELNVLECNLDDCSPQVLGALLETLLERGALDAWVLPAVMKKSRPGHLLGALCDDAHKAAVETLLLKETTTLGVRCTRVSRTALERRFDEVVTPWGPVKVKVGLRSGEVLNAAPEFEDCRALANKAQVPIKEVLAAAMSAWRAR